MNTSLDERLKKRFCKEMNIPIQVFKEPYFTERLYILDKYYNSVEKYKVFIDSVNSYENLPDYFKDYNEVKDNAINYLNGKLDRFKSVHLSDYPIKNSFKSADVYKETNVDKKFVSIDMKEANFSCIKHFDSNIFPNMNCYKDFIREFTNNQHFINSKYIRQVIFGNQNPKRQVRYQKFIMDNLLTELLSIIPQEQIACFTNDEIVIEIINDDLEDVRKITNSFSTKENIKLTFEPFVLKKAYIGYKKVHEDGSVDFKTLNSMDLIFAIREHENQDVQENDKVFVYENKLAKLL